jgi:dephospho-CoA kinase
MSLKYKRLLDALDRLDFEAARGVVDDLAAIYEKPTPAKIALTGKARAGKDRVADYLRLRYDFTPLALADSLKAVAGTLYPELFANVKPRALLQTLGEHLCEYDAHVFINEALRRANGLNRVVITDLRKPTEYESLKAAGFTVIRVSAPDEIRLARAKADGEVFDEADFAHSTEAHVDGFAVDFEIDNGGVFADTERQIDEAMAQLGVKAVVPF